ncbi:MAG: hypothetical protein ACI4NI_11815 [Candidatus Ornithospirochaeta sp.]
MNNKRIDSKAEVETFLSDLKEILESDTFVIERDLDILLKKKGESANDPYSTDNTLATLEYDKTDVCRELKKLTVREYSETIIDNRDSALPPFYVFYRNIQSQDVYIKVKIRDRQTGKVFCVSFHFARFPNTKPFPYAG